MLLIKNIHRHTGGLEITGKFIKKSVYIHRHTGGLENIKQGEKQLFSYSPPHRRLRKSDNDK